MKKILAIILIFSTLTLTTVSSCKKTDNIKHKDIPSQINNPKVESIWGVVITVVACIVVAIECTEGQATTSTTTHTSADGSSTTITTTSCDGMGHCSVSMTKSTFENNENSLNIGDSAFFDTRDVLFHANIIKSDDGSILLALDSVQNSIDIYNQFFYSDSIKFLSPGTSYIVNNPTA